jgi:type I restriction enzyme S subunit
MCKNIVGMANINAQELQDIQILIPPIHLQQKFASIVADTEQLRQKQKQSEMELENLFQALLQKYFG